jgi:hypothetical protein
MSDLTKRLKPFEKRVRLVRSWRGLAIGACVGTAISAVWAVFDWRSILYTEWAWMGFVTGACALTGAIAGFALKVPLDRLAESIDRRAGLKDRLTTAREREDGSDAFDSALRTDAEEKLAVIEPKAVYPIKLNRWHGGALLLAAIASAIFVLGNTPIALSEDARHDRDEMKKQGETVKRIVKQNFETPDATQEMSGEEKKLADQLRRFDRDLEKAHMSKEEALQKSNELSQNANDLMKDAEKTSEQSLGEAQTAREQLEKGELDKAGLSGINSQMAEMPGSERSQKLDQAKKAAKNLEDRLQALQRQLAEVLKKLQNKNLTEEERKALEAQKAALEKQIEELTKQLNENAQLQKALELSKQAQDVFERMRQDPLYKQLLEIEKKLAQNSSSASKSGRPQLTDAERAQLKKELEELAARLKDGKAMKAYLAALLEAMKKANQLGRCSSASLGLQGLPSGMPPPAGPGDTTPGVWTGDTGHIHKLDKPEASRGSTTTDVISGEQRPSDGPQPYVEIRAPSTVGNRSSVPYKDVLPSYEKKAESALNRQQIPKEHQKRVKEYFDSLTGAKKN